MKRLIILSISLLGCTTIFAQDKAKDIIEDVSNTIKSYDVIQADFSYTMVNKVADIKEEQEGTLILKGDKFKVDIAGRQIISNGETVWIYSEDDNSVNIMTQEDFNAEEPDLNPNTIFTKYEEGFDYKYVKDGNSGGKSVHVIDVFPQEEKDYEKIRMEIDKSNNHIVKSTTMPKEKEGSTFTLVVKKLTANPTVEDNIFSFNPDDYEDIEVVDFR